VRSSRIYPPPGVVVVLARRWTSWQPAEARTVPDPLASAAEVADHLVPSVETLVLDYRSGGSSELLIREQLDEGLSPSALDAAHALLVGRGEHDALALAEARDFALYAATNGFGDDFLALFAWVSPERFAEYRESLDSMSPDRTALRGAAAALRDAVGASNKDGREVRFVALGLADNIVRGRHGEYRFEEEFDRGGFATIHRAQTATGKVVALKKLYVRDEEAIARLRREIQEQQRIHHPAVMPVIDHDLAFRWFIMPLAKENLAQAWAEGRLNGALLVRVLRAAIDGLAAAHELGLVHRDVSPRNILRVDDVWVVADWGVVRRPRGLTTMVRTQGELGTNGFAAPELFRDAHGAGPPADVYALGRIAAWAVVHEWPEQNVPLLPEGPWRQFVRRATEHVEARRPQSMAELSALLEQVEKDLRSAATPTTGAQPRFFTESLDDMSVAAECLEFCLAHPADSGAYVDFLPRVTQAALTPWIESRPNDLGSLVGTLEGHVLDPGVWAERDFDLSNLPIAWLRRVARAAADGEADGLLEDASAALMRTEAKWKRFPQRHQTRTWLEELKGDQARTVARVLAREPDAVDWLMDEGWSPTLKTTELRIVLARRQRA
jgi:hypothetical protein